MVGNDIKPTQTFHFQERNSNFFWIANLSKQTQTFHFLISTLGGLKHHFSREKL